MLEEFETRGQDELSREVLELRRQVETLTTSLETLSVNFAAHQHSSIDGSEKLYNESIRLKPGSYIQGMLSGGDGKEIEIKSGEIVVSQSYHSLKGEGGANDTVERISSVNQVDGQLLFLRGKVGNDITFTNTGNISMISDFTMNVSYDSLLLVSDRTGWNEVARSSNSSRFNGFVSLGDESEKIISSGVITASSGYHRIETESLASTDDLDTISEPSNGIPDGSILVIRPTSGTRTIVVKHNTGNLRLTGDFTMNDNEDTLTLIWNGSSWLEISRSDNS